MPIETIAGEYAFGRFRVDAARRTLWVDSRQATLGIRAFDLLLALIERRDRIRGRRDRRGDRCVHRRRDPLRALIKALTPFEMLIALDNAEHLVDEVAAVAQALVEGAPGVRVLVTSQVPLKVAAERVYRLGALSVPETDVPLSGRSAMARLRCSSNERTRSTFASCSTRATRIP